MVSSEHERERRDHSLRRTGIPPLGLIPWGAHICMFYEEPEDLIEAYADYFAAGLADNERCVWALSDPMDSERAVAHLRHAVVGFEDYLAAGAIELVPRRQWSLREDEFDSRRFTNGWLRKVDGTLAQGFAGLRIGGDAFWMQTHLWARFHEYEAEIERSFANARMISLCAYPLRAARAVDLLDVARAHYVSVARRKGQWEILESTKLAAAQREVHGPDEAADIPSRPFPGHERLTPRERATLAMIVNGASNKQAARALGISPRTIEFHRTNIMHKLEVRNVVALIGLVRGTN